MRKNQIFNVLSLALVMLQAVACSSREEPAEEPVIGMANPASVHCADLGGKLEIRDTEEGQIGVCVYFDGSECEEWALYRGECELGFDFPDNPDVIPNEASDFCRRQGYEFWVGTDEEGQYGYCVFPDGSQCEEWAYYRGECQPGDHPSEEDATGLVPGGKGLSSMQAVAVYGYVVSADAKGPSGSVLVLMPEDFGRVFVSGETAEVEDQIASIRDKNEPANKASFWGRLECPTMDECLLTASQMHIDGPGDLPEPVAVDGWEGVIYSGPPGPRSGGDDYFALLGEMPFQYGIWSEDEALLQQLEDLRDSGQAVRIWGELYAGRMDWNAAQIVVTRFELLEANPTDIPPAPNW